MSRWSRPLRALRKHWVVLTAVVAGAVVGGCAMCAIWLASTTAYHAYGSLAAAVQSMPKPEIEETEGAPQAQAHRNSPRAAKPKRTSSPALPSCMGPFTLLGSGDVVSAAAGGETRARVVAASVERLVLEHAAGSCTLSLRGAHLSREDAPAPGDEPSSDSPVEGATAGISVSDLQTSIRKIDDASFTLGMGVVHSILERPGTGVTGVQLEPSTGTEPRTLIASEPGFFEYLGLRQGDQLIDANGEPLRTLEDLSGAFLGLRPSQTLALNLEREGTRTTLHYSAIP